MQFQKWMKLNLKSYLSFLNVLANLALGKEWVISKPKAQKFKLKGRIRQNNNSKNYKTGLLQLKKIE